MSVFLVLLLIFKILFMKTKLKFYFLGLSVSLLVLTSCEQKQSLTTGWNLNDKNYGGFEDIEYIEQETGPGLVLIEGGTFSMGRVEQDVMYDWNNIPRRVTVSSFYMDQTVLLFDPYKMKKR